AEYYFESPEIRESFLGRLAEKGELRNFKQSAEGKDGIIYELFRADAAAILSDFEHAVGAYQNLNRIYPHTAEFSERLIALTRSLGQKNRQILTESAKFSQASADYDLSSAANRTRSGEIFAELGDYEQSREQWEKIIPTASGDRETYLDTATVYWDYFQYADALRTIGRLREKVGDNALYAFETGAIFEAQHKQNEAVAEYVKAFAAHDDDEKKEKAQRRLATLAAGKPEILSVVKGAFAAENSRRKNDPFLALGYAEFLRKAKENQPAALILNRAVADSQDDEFLEAARDFYQTADDQTNEQFVLKKLAAAAKSPRRAIRFELQSAKNYEEAGQRDAAKNMLANLVRRFPTNYGVLTESSDVYWSLGFEKDSIGVLQNALPKSRGAYQTALSEKLSGLLVKTDQLPSAEQILTKLHDENRANTEIFHELTNVCARTGNAELMRKAFAETVAALRASDDNDRRALDEQIADLRGSMIEAFTSAKDYRSAIEQHIEIINREPESEELTDNAVRYVQRYGGADILRDYYLKLSAEAFKNYRWNVVLARIYQANNDDENAVKSYQTALVNQPEMPELYLAIADIETSRSNYDAALSNLDAALKLTNDAPEYVKKKIEILKKAGRLAEVETEQAKLPAEPEKKAAMVDDFAEARNTVEKEKSRELYRAAFAKLSENPLYGDLQTADLTAYVNAARADEPLDRVAERLWNLRGKLAQMTVEKNSTDAGAAQKRLNLLNDALTEAVGTLAENYGTDEERHALHENLLKQINAVSTASDQFHTLSTIQNLSVRAGFGDLTETILRKRVEQPLPDSERNYDARRLADFYNERGAYQKAFDVLKKYDSGDWSDDAAAARLINNRAAELEALRAIYRKPADQLAVSENRDVARFLEILYADNRAELSVVAGQSSVYQLQTINFLLGKGERELAHKAIENAALPLAWKTSRHAETSLALHEYEDSAECYFCTALQLDSIGNLVRQTPDKKSFLLNDDWFRLTREYGEWLFEKPDKTFAPSNFLAAMTENTPSDANQQFKLGEFYLQKKDYEKAVEHLRLAIETDNFAVADEAKSATLGAAYYLSGDHGAAETAWKSALAGDEDQSVESGLIYFDSLNKFGLGGEARKAMPPIIIGFLKNGNAEDSKELQELIRKIAASFDDEKQRANYFREILNRRLTDKSLAAMLLNENLIAPNERKQFYELIISRSDEVTDSDYDFTAVRARGFGDDDAEAVYEQENDYRVEEPESKRVEWQRKYLEYLLERRENYPQIEVLISAIEKELSSHYARPAWLRVAKINAQIRAGKYDREAAERFVGIRVTEAASAVKPPNLVRFNDVRSVLLAENKTAEAAALAESFFARNLALNQFDATTFAGLGRAFFQKNESEKALHVLRLMVAASDDAKKDATLAEVFALESVKARTADTRKIEANESGLPSQADALRIAAEISAEYNQNDAAIEFRRSLAELNPTDSINKIALAKLLNQRGEQSEAVNLLTQIISDRDARRTDRWQARSLLNAPLPDDVYDPFSRFYNGIAAAKSSTANAADFFVNALIADKDAPTDARQKLMEIYALNGQSFAALKFAETDQSAKSDDLLRTLSEAAEKVGDLPKASEYERARANGGDAARLAVLRKLFTEKNSRATDFTVNTENTRSL
ncbi:MAG: tetratricopeptide repeat protein, partial [Acidobacteriota bacterium]|nr:tetratricopeptide repeat protein [Acidobacteriota bacterium]